MKPGDLDPKTNLKIGSPEWRDAQDQEFDTLIDDPSKWQFNTTPDQQAAIASAYKGFQAEFGQNKYPDLNAIRLMVINFLPEIEEGVIEDIVERENQTDEDVVRRTSGIQFWTDFNDDMPEAFKRRGSMHIELNIAWQDYKIKAILKDLKFNYMDWETQDLAINVKSPGSMRRAAAEMEKLEATGFALYNTDYKDEVVEHYFRKGKVIEP